jgi:hypothetical protein
VHPAAALGEEGRVCAGAGVQFQQAGAGRQQRQDVPAHLRARPLDDGMTRAVGIVDAGLAGEAAIEAVEINH